jgi:hypothetical protein
VSKPLHALLSGECSHSPSSPSRTALKKGRIDDQST